MSRIIFFIMIYTDTDLIIKDEGVFVVFTDDFEFLILAVRESVDMDFMTVFVDG